MINLHNQDCMTAMAMMPDKAVNLAICDPPYQVAMGGGKSPVCKIKFIGGLPSTAERIQTARECLGLEEGEFLKQDAGEEAARILGRGRLSKRNIVRKKRGGW